MVETKWRTQKKIAEMLDIPLSKLAPLPRDLTQTTIGGFLSVARVWT
jgi:hypothetical protein